jgi:hypothetical protein
MELIDLGTLGWSAQWLSQERSPTDYHHLADWPSAPHFHGRQSVHSKFGCGWSEFLPAFGHSRESDEQRTSNPTFVECVTFVTIQRSDESAAYARADQRLPTNLRHLKVKVGTRGLFMHKHTAEAVICVMDSNSILKGLCASVQEYCRSIRRLGIVSILDFGDARAILRPMKQGLLIRVEAQELVTFCGIQMLLQARLSTIKTFSGGTVEWDAAGSLTIGEIRERLADRQNWSSER